MNDISNISNCHIQKECLSQHILGAQADLRSNNVLSDAVIHLDNGSYFPVHRIIMSAASEYFRALFTSTLNVIHPTDVKLHGVRKEAMLAILDFAYTRTTEITNANVTEIISVAHYFGMAKLEDLCSGFIKSMLTPENSIFVWLELRCNLYQHELDKITKTYILRNFIEIASKSEQIWEIPFEIFYEIINDDRLNVKAEEPVWEVCLRWIDFDVESRRMHVAKLMSALRLGLMGLNYFVHNVKEHPYVKYNTECNQMTMATLSFLCDLNSINVQEEFFETPKMAIPRIPHDIIFAIGGWSGGQARPYVEVYDTRADRWITLNNHDPFGSRAYHGVTTCLDHKIYCVGGYDGREHFNMCTIFDPVNNTWKEIAPMHSRRCYVSVVELNGYIYALGGHNGVERLNSVERYDPTTNQWTMMSSMLAVRSDASATTLNNKIIIMGGFNGQSCLNSAEEYDPDTNEWTAIEDMQVRRSGLCAISFNGALFAFGGFNGILRLSSSEKYDPTTKTWTTVRPMSSPRSNFAIEILDDLIFVIGGFDGRATINVTECYNPETNEWFEATNLSLPRSALSACVVVGLPNIDDYTYGDRHLLLEERRLFSRGKTALNISHYHGNELTYR